MKCQFPKKGSIYHCIQGLASPSLLQSSSRSCCTVEGASSDRRRSAGPNSESLEGKNASDARRQQVVWIINSYGKGTDASPTSLRVSGKIMVHGREQHGDNRFGSLAASRVDGW